MTERTPREKVLSSNYLDILRFSHDAEWDRALKAANRILHMAPNETKALHCKVVCLIQQSKFEEALHTINKNQNILNNLVFEKAYCHYRLNQPEQALHALGEEDKDLRLQELKAQVLYRLEKYSDALELYNKLIDTVNDDYKDERETNLAAVISQLESKELIGKKSLAISENTYELCYNKACCFISQEQFTEAEKKLKQCEKICRESLEEESYSEEEIDVELALIRIQLAYVYQKLGRVKEAQQIYLTCLKQKLEDIALAAVAANNIVVINKDQNIFDSKKKIKIATNDLLIHKLPSKQKKYIALNNATFLYYSNQLDQCIKACNVIEKQWKEISCQAKLIHVLCIAKKENVASAIAAFKNMQFNDANEDLLAKLTCTQLLLSQGEKLEACKILENLGENSYRPGIVGALITLHLAMGNEEIALKVFEKTIEWYQKNKVKGDLSNMWRQAAEFHIQNGHPQVAVNSLEELLKLNPNDRKTIAQLVLAYALFNKSKAVSLCQRLESIDCLKDNVDLESLESSNWLALKKVATNKTEMSPSTPKGDIVKKKRKHRKHKGKLPKNYDSSIPPDPERWLPKYERSAYRKKRDRRVKDVIKGSQGTATGQSEQYEFSKSEVVSQDSSVSSVEPSPATSKSSVRKNHQKKKNKRR